ncbi:MAG: NAD(P)-dependent alcohol dehydrogenase [Oligoflexus sp.]
MTIQAYAAEQAGKKLVSYAYEEKPLGPYEIDVKVSHCGICHSDLHLIDNDWQISQYPLVPGHEIVGTVQAAGQLIQHFQRGQRVGIGWQRTACMQCEYCMRGDENLCLENQGTCVGHHGGFAERIIADGRFAFAIPESLSSENAAPLLCGGITVYAPLKSFDIRANMRVGVIGIGGLGHLALQFSRAFGCEVTAFSSSADKKEEALALGAHHFVSSKDANEMQKLASSFDFILSTVSADLDWNLYLNLLRPDGKLCIVGIPQSELKIQAFPLIAGRKSICGSPIGSRTMMNEMLEFAARHGIEARTELMPMSEVNVAIEKVRANQARYRMVLKTD